jgi:hypothetical protein
MLVKLGLAVAALAYATVSLAAVDYRELYNEMYPANGLKRGVLGLCQAAKPTFVRAIEQDRVDCYDSMPSSIERAIGWVRTSARLAAMRAPTGVELAEKLLQEAELRYRGGPDGVLRFASIAASSGGNSSACEGTTLPTAATRDLALAPANDPKADDQLARRIAKGDDKLLAELGLAKPRTRLDATGPNELPILPLAGSSGSSVATGAAAGSPELGSGAKLPIAPDAASGCRTPA